MDSSGCFILHKQPYSNITDTIDIDRDEFPSVTWENSPQEVTLEIVNGSS